MRFLEKKRKEGFEGQIAGLVLVASWLTLTDTWQNRLPGVAQWLETPIDFQM